MNSQFFSLTFSFLPFQSTLMSLQCGTWVTVHHLLDNPGNVVHSGPGNGVSFYKLRLNPPGKPDNDHIYSSCSTFPQSIPSFSWWNQTKERIPVNPPGRLQKLPPCEETFAVHDCFDRRYNIFLLALDPVWDFLRAFFRRQGLFI